MIVCRLLVFSPLVSCGQHDGGISAHQPILSQGKEGSPRNRTMQDQNQIGHCSVAKWWCTTRIFLPGRGSPPLLHQCRYQVGFCQAIPVRPSEFRLPAMRLAKRQAQWRSSKRMWGRPGAEKTKGRGFSGLVGAFEGPKMGIADFCIFVLIAWFPIILVVQKIKLLERLASKKRSPSVAPKNLKPRGIYIANDVILRCGCFQSHEGLDKALV